MCKTQVHDCIKYEDIHGGCKRFLRSINHLWRCEKVGEAVNPEPVCQEGPQTEKGKLIIFLPKFEYKGRN